MCGISGIWRRSGSSAESIRDDIRRMSATIRHRGPDDDGEFVDETNGLAFGFRRLKIIDLTAAGAQPMTSSSGRYVIEFNGEVYNHRELLAELGDMPMRGHSDTEVMLACFERWGVRRAVERFIGMFAFALWDRQERALFLVRDRAGVKPLYYAEGEDFFAFASELKAIAALPDFDRRLDEDAVAEYVQLGWVPGPMTIYASARKLPPGTILRVTSSRTELETYWNAREIAERVFGTFQGSENDALDAAHELLRDSVRLRMIADVPLGVFLSSGIDSTLVTALMQQQASQPVRTFTIGFEDSGADEAPLARATAAHLGTEHTEAYVTAQEALDAVALMPSMFDEPFGDSSAIPTYLVSRMARPSVTVALSGDGGDELFGGYHRYFLGQQLARRAARLPRFLAPALGVLPGQRARSYATALTEGLLGVYERNMRDTTFGPIRQPATGNRQLSDAVAEIMLRDFTTYMRDDILVKVDRSSMAVSLETREPLLDHRLVELAWSLPLSMKIRDGRGKWLLRSLLSRYVPQSMIDREKRGFGLPLAAWLRGPLRGWAEELLQVRSGVFDPKRVQHVWRDHLRGANREGTLWRVLMFEAFFESRA
ncbi:MAG TPA: asparagine synthase (glutamine-hydrolyzing) [Thermoanaerobaculia bacterium]